jgi:hypothetical protein
MRSDRYSLPVLPPVYSSSRSLYKHDHHPSEKAKLYRLMSCDEARNGEFNINATISSFLQLITDNSTAPFAVCRQDSSRIFHPSGWKLRHKACSMCSLGRHFPFFCFLSAFHEKSPSKAQPDLIADISHSMGLGMVSGLVMQDFFTLKDTTGQTS